MRSFPFEFDGGLLIRSANGCCLLVRRAQSTMLCLLLYQPK